MKHVNDRIVETGVRSSGHPGVLDDFQRAREMRRGTGQAVARAAGWRSAPAISGQSADVQAPAIVGVGPMALAVSAIYLFA